MSLYEAPKDMNLVIIEIHPNCDARNKLITMGIQANDILIKLNNPSFGPVLVQNVSNGANKLAIGKGLAQKISVSYAQ